MGEAESSHINVGKNKWLVVKSPDDLFHLGIDIDFRKLNYKPSPINSLLVSYFVFLICEK